MIPEFNASGLLPEGIHWAGLDELQNRYARNGHRERLFRGLVRALNALRMAGCSALYLDGSFVTAKEYPGDYDACWEVKGVKLGVLDPVLVDFSNCRAAQKAKYFGEFFPAHFTAEKTSPFRTFLTFFQTDKSSGEKKGIIGVNLTVIV